MMPPVVCPGTSKTKPYLRSLAKQEHPSGSAHFLMSNAAVHTD